MNIYYRNEKAMFVDRPKTQSVTPLENIYDPMLELAARFEESHVKIKGVYGDSIVAADSLCIGYTNADRYELTVKDTIERTFTGRIEGLLAIHNFETVFIDEFKLELWHDDEEDETPLYLGHLFIGQKTVFPRFSPEPESGTTLNSAASRSFGGQVFGIRRRSLDSFAVNFPRITAYEREVIKEYVNAVLTTEPHIIDPYPQARQEFPPMYVTLNTENVNFTKRNENGFYYTGGLSWQEAK
jgi:hypothetical protein